MHLEALEKPTHREKIECDKNQRIKKAGLHPLPERFPEKENWKGDRAHHSIDLIIIPY